MGQIYLAEDQRLQRTVAIKTLKSAQALTQSDDTDHKGDDGAQAITNALREARLLAKLNHSNIVQIYDITQDNEEICLVMEYLIGKALHHFQQEQVTSLTQKLAIISQISKGLTAAHEQGIVHCDLKPSNIIVASDYGVKIVDFGIATLSKNEGASNNNSQSFGSQTAMSPEQLKNALPDSQTTEIDFRSDLFSLGIIAFQLISGRHPFSNALVASSTTETAKNILKGQCQSAQDIVPQLPQELVRLLNQLLAHRAEDRPQSSQWVTQQFEQMTKHLSQQEILAEDTQPLTAELSTTLSTGLAEKEEANNKDKRRKFTYAAMAVLITLLAAIGVYHEALFPPTELPTRYVVVLPATVTNENPDRPIAQMQKDLVTATLDDAIRQSIINTKALRLISRKEVSGISKDANGEVISLAKIAAATGASDIITTELSCNNVRCNVTLSRLTAKSSEKSIDEKGVKKWTVLAQKQWPSQVEDYYDIKKITQSYLASIYPQYNEKYLRIQSVKQQDYLTFSKLYNVITLEGRSDVANLNQLQDILISSPYLYSAYALYRETAIDLYHKTNEIKYAEKAKKILSLAPPEYKFSLFQAVDKFWIALALSDFKQAKQQLNIAMQRGIDESTRFELQAALHMDNNELLQAISNYQSALILRPSTNILYNLALSYYWLSDFANAKQTLKRLLNTIPQDYDAKQLLAGIYLSIGELKQAISLYEDIIKLNPQSNELDNLGLAYTLAGHYQEALKMAMLAINSSPNHPTKILNLADSQMILGYTTQAKLNYQKVVEIQKSRQNIKSWLERSQAYVHLGQYKEAIKALNQAKKLAPNNGEVAFAAALVYSQLGEHLSAINQVEEALAAGFGLVWFNLPWFDPLCTNTDFQEILIQADKAERCQLNS